MQAGQTSQTLAGAGGGRGAAVGRDFGDRQRFASLFDGGGGLQIVHGRRVARIKAGRQGCSTNGGQPGADRSAQTLAPEPGKNAKMSRGDSPLTLPKSGLRQFFEKPV
jgi:hypothetical protein